MTSIEFLQRGETMTNSKQKGARAERELANILKEHGYDAHRTAQYCGNTGDAADVVGLPGFHIECKHQERMELYKWYAQAVNDSKGKEDIPLVIHRQNNKPWLVSLSLEDFLKIIGEKK